MHQARPEPGQRLIKRVQIPIRHHGERAGNVGRCAEQPLGNRQAACGDMRSHTLDQPLDGAVCPARQTKKRFVSGLTKSSFAIAGNRRDAAPVNGDNAPLMATMRADAIAPSSVKQRARATPYRLAILTPVWREVFGC